jgi:rare lipoprotein A
VCRVNDTGGFAKYGRILDMSKGAFSKIGDVNKGVIKVKIRVVK